MTSEALPVAMRWAVRGGSLEAEELAEERLSHKA